MPPVSCVFIALVLGLYASPHLQKSIEKELESTTQLVVVVVTEFQSSKYQWKHIHVLLMTQEHTHTHHHVESPIVTNILVTLVTLAVERDANDNIFSNGPSSVSMFALGNLQVVSRYEQFAGPFLEMKQR